MYRSGYEAYARDVASSICPADVPDEDPAEYAPLFEDLGLDGADTIWRRQYPLHPDSRSLEGVRRTDPGVDVGGLLRTVMRREEEASTDWRPLRPRVLAHLVYKGMGNDVARLVRSKEGRYGSCILGNSGRADAIALCRELARIGRLPSSEGQPSASFPTTTRTAASSMPRIS